ncbi:GNAT family N-acetyltransferase [Geomicrobium sp. JSM 1781026]|uniref:GNAT family N-acetyltransferase n=1 Tax=Geomicrobium sp. JSM 1781026 TaxID=3344580 RepID=UPI0035C15D99
MCQAVDEYRIVTERLVLRTLRMADAKQVATLCNNKKLYESTLHLPFPYAVADAKAWIAHETKNTYRWAITTEDAKKVIGSMSLSENAQHGHGEIGYWLGEPYWGRGYATEAACAVLEWGFQSKGFHRIYGRHMTFNPASGRVLEKCGMKKEGVLREHVHKDGAFLDLVYYGKLVSDSV